MELPFREVYKCSWLKLTQTEKKVNSLLKVRYILNIQYFFMLKK